MAAASGLEALTGAILVVAPSFAAQLLFGQPLLEPGPSVARVAGLALVSLSVACWPRPDGRSQAALEGLLVWNVLVAAFLAGYVVTGATAGILLLPAICVHALLSAFLARTRLQSSAGVSGGVKD
jgi:hypothetical protein